MEKNDFLLQRLYNRKKARDIIALVIIEFWCVYY